jgi:hypothetical protein
MNKDMWNRQADERLRQATTESHLFQFGRVPSDNIFERPEIVRSCESESAVRFIQTTKEAQDGYAYMLTGMFDQPNLPIPGMERLQ